MNDTTSPDDTNPMDDTTPPEGTSSTNDTNSTNGESADRTSNGDEPVDSSIGTFDASAVGGDKTDEKLDDVTDSLPGSGRLGVSDDDLNGVSGPIQLP